MASIRKHMLGLAAAVAAVHCVEMAAQAESLATLNAVPSSTAVVTMTVSITTSLGTSTDSDVKTVAVLANGQARVPQDSPPWNAITLDAMHIQPGNATFQFQFFCFPFIGCQNLNIALSNLVLDLTAPVSSPIGATGQASFLGAPFQLTGNYATTGIATTSGVLSNVGAQDFGCRVTSLKGQLMRLDQCTISTATTVIDPASLPAGVTAMTVTLATNLANCVLVGPWVVPNPFDLDGDGSVGAADLSLLLSQWGGAGSADFDASGAVDAPDLSAMLSNWG
ncbi:MAG: hypothetical protein QM516_06965 [Limnohabitans sp.]|nr:hypothetical protein [Limnohabitans sp.]